MATFDYQVGIYEKYKDSRGERFEDYVDAYMYYIETISKFLHCNVEFDRVEFMKYDEETKTYKAMQSFTESDLPKTLQYKDNEKVERILNGKHYVLGQIINDARKINRQFIRERCKNNDCTVVFKYIKVDEKIIKDSIVKVTAII